MSSEKVSSDEIIRIGKSAKWLLDTPEFNDGIKAVRDNAMNIWKNTQPEQSKEREECYFLYLAVGMLENHFKTLANNAKLEQHRLKRNQE